MAVNENFMSAPAAVSDTAAKRAREKRFYLSIGILFPLVIVAGFARSYYLRFAFDDVPPIPSLLVHVHGAVMTAWVLLFTTQILLARTKRIKMHMTLGLASIALAVLMVVVGYFTAAASARRIGLETESNGMPAITFLVIPLADLVTFSVVYAAAIMRRKRSADHKRLMLLTAINFLPPSLGRMQFAASLGPLWFIGVPVVLFIAAVAYDRYRNGKFNRAMVAATVFLLVSIPLRFAVAGTEAWRQFAYWIAG
ncbi:MAG: hypothetical protein ACK4S4_14940 [Pyrinomonadaceae bacterium]